MNFHTSCHSHFSAWADQRQAGGRRQTSKESATRAEGRKEEGMASVREARLGFCSLLITKYLLCVMCLLFRVYYSV